MDLPTEPMIFEEFHSQPCILTGAPQKLPAGLKVRQSIDEVRGRFKKKLYLSTNRTQTTAASNIFMQKIDTCILDLRSYAKTCPCLKPRSRKASELMVKLRSSSLEKIWSRAGDKESTPCATTSSIEGTLYLETYCAKGKLFFILLQYYF